LVTIHTYRSLCSEKNKEDSLIIEKGTEDKEEMKKKRNNRDGCRSCIFEAGWVTKFLNQKKAFRTVRHPPTLKNCFYILDHTPYLTVTTRKGGVIN